MKNQKSKYYTLEYRPEEKAADIYIFGAITSWAWEEFGEMSSYGIVKQLKEIPEDAAITVHINSNGGEVKEGLGIYNALKGRNVTTVCEGFAVSAASVVFCAGKTRIMQPASLLFIHQALMATIGNADELEKDAQDLRKITEAIVNSYKEAGVDVTAGYKAVELMKQHVARTATSGVLDGIGCFGGLFQLDRPVDTHVVQLGSHGIQIVQIQHAQEGLLKGIDSQPVR